MEHEVIYEYEKSLRSILDYDIKNNQSYFANQEKDKNQIESFH